MADSEELSFVFVSYVSRIMDGQTTYGIHIVYETKKTVIKGVTVTSKNSHARKSYKEVFLKHVH